MAEYRSIEIYAVHNVMERCQIKKVLERRVSTYRARAGAGTPAVGVDVSLRCSPLPKLKRAQRRVGAATAAFRSMEILDEHDQLPVPLVQNTRHTCDTMFCAVRQVFLADLKLGIEGFLPHRPDIVQGFAVRTLE